MEKNIYIKDMNCKHCVKRIEEGLKPLKLKKLKIDLKNKSIKFLSNNNLEDVLNKLIEINYEGEVIE